MRFFLCNIVLLAAHGNETPLRFEAAPTGRKIIARLPAEFAAKLPAGKMTQQQGEAVLTLSLLEDKNPGPSMLGKYERAGNELMFLPRFPLSAGATYRASLRAAGSTASLDYVMPMLATKAPPKVVQIYPTADVLPA